MPCSDAGICLHIALGGSLGHPGSPGCAGNCWQGQSIDPEPPGCCESYSCPAQSQLAPATASVSDLTQASGCQIWSFCTQLLFSFSKIQAWPISFPTYPIYPPWEQWQESVTHTGLLLHLSSLTHTCTHTSVPNKRQQRIHYFAVCPSHFYSISQTFLWLNMHTESIHPVFHNTPLWTASRS